MTARSRSSGSDVLLAGLGLIVLQLAFRAWAIYGAWFQFDDFAFMSRVQNEPISSFFQSYGGHLMPAGFFLSLMNFSLDPFNFLIPATELLFMQALASVGCLVFLTSAFGRRRGILAPLAVYLFSVISLPAFIWWAAGVNQLPMQIAFFWGGWAHLNYLRSGRFPWALSTMGITLAALAFQEKSLFLFVLYALLALGYFASGDIVARVTALWRQYRAGVALYSVIAVGYLLIYLRVGLTFAPDRANDTPLGPVITNMGGRAFGTGIVGGPLRWQHLTGVFAVADPGDLVVLVAVALLGLLGFEIARSRSRSKRAWFLPGILLSLDIVLVAAGRASFVGANIALDYRYQSELAAAAAVGLALSLFPLLGAVEKVEPLRDSAFLDRPARTATAMALVCVLGTYSSTLYAQHWQSDTRPEVFFTTAGEELTSAPDPVPLVDTGIPDFLLWGFGYPENAISHVLRLYSEHTYFPDVRTDEMFMLADDGSVRPMVVEPVRAATEPRKKGCPYPVKDGQVEIPLDGPVIGGGWWVRAAYAADSASPVTIGAGDNTFDVDLRQGLHNLFFKADGEFDSIRFTGIDPEATVCFTELELGFPKPFSTGTPPSPSPQ